MQKPIPLTGDYDQRLLQNSQRALETVLEECAFARITSLPPHALAVVAPQSSAYIHLVHIPQEGLSPTDTLDRNVVFISRSKIQQILRYCDFAATHSSNPTSTFVLETRQGTLSFFGPELLDFRNALQTVASYKGHFVFYRTLP